MLGRARWRGWGYGPGRIEDRTMPASQPHGLRPTCPWQTLSGPESCLQETSSNSSSSGSSDGSASSSDDSSDSDSDSSGRRRGGKRARQGKGGAVVVHRDGTLASASADELKIAAELAKDPWGRWEAHGMERPGGGMWHEDRGLRAEVGQDSARVRSAMDACKRQVLR